MTFSKMATEISKNIVPLQELTHAGDNVVVVKHLSKSKVFVWMFFLDIHASRTFVRFQFPLKYTEQINKPLGVSLSHAVKL